MKITFDNVIEKVVQSRTISRREKLNELRKFLKECSANSKTLSEKEAAIVETLKNVRQAYTLQESNEKKRDKIKEL